MEITGTREAFTALISCRGVHNVLGISATTVRGWRMRVKEGKLISLDKMEEMLLKAGANVVSEKVWEVDVDMRLDLPRLAKYIEKEINTNSRQFFTGDITVHLQSSDQYEPNIVDFFGTKYKVLCSLERSFPNIFHTAIDGGNVRDKVHIDIASEKFNVHDWVREIVCVINESQTPT